MAGDKWILKEESWRGPIRGYRLFESKESAQEMRKFLSGDWVLVAPPSPKKKAEAP